MDKMQIKEGKKRQRKRGGQGRFRVSSNSVQVPRRRQGVRGSEEQCEPSMWREDMQKELKFGQKEQSKNPR